MQDNLEERKTSTKDEIAASLKLFTDFATNHNGTSREELWKQACLNNRRELIKAWNNIDLLNSCLRDEYEYSYKTYMKCLKLIVERDRLKLELEEMKRDSKA